MIEGLRVKPLRPMADERGRLMEMLRCDDEVFIKFGQAYITTAYPGVVKAWHYHKAQTDFLAALTGMVKLVLYDPRKNSPTRGAVEEFFIGVHNPLLVVVPPLVYHGFKCISDTEAIVLNCPTEPYDRQNPDEFRLPPDSPDVPYRWERVDR
jgi:dTDP-4-dehydrorhamnose 3,5-epimerase